MRYNATIRLRKDATAGRVPVFILDGVVRKKLLQQIGIALKPHLPIKQVNVADESEPVHHAGVRVSAAWRATNRVRFRDNPAMFQGPLTGQKTKKSIRRKLACA